MKNQWKWLTEQANRVWHEMGRPKSSRFDGRKEVTMNIKWNHIAGQWAHFQGNVKERWSELTDHDLIEVNGHFEALSKKLQEKYGLERDEANQQIDLWTASIEL